MRSLERAASPADWVETGTLTRFVLDTASIVDAEVRKIRHDPFDLVTRAAQPVLWLVVFGEVLARTGAIPTGGLGYLDYLAPGVLAQSALFVAIFYGIAAIWERDLGIVQKLLVSPTPRAALVLGKALAAGLKALVQAPIIYVLAALLGVHLRLDAPSLAGVAAIMVVGSALFATFSLIIACVVRSRDRFMGIGQLLTMPLFFASSAIYPTSLMPPWLQAAASLNPLSYMVDALRTLMVGAASERGLGLDALVLGVGLCVLVALAARLYPRLA